MIARATVPLRAGIGHKFLMNKEYSSVIIQLNADLHRAIQEFMVRALHVNSAYIELNRDLCRFR